MSRAPWWAKLGGSVALALGLSLGAVRVQAAEPAAIAQVRSLAELRKGKPVLREGDWELRLGLAEGGEAASDWRLLYCLASYVGREAKSGSPRPIGEMLGSARPLGPLSYAAHPASIRYQEAVVLAPQIPSGVVYLGQYGRRGEFVEELYCGPVALVGHEDILLRVYSRDIKMIAQSVLPLRLDLPHPWQAFLAPQKEEAADPPPTASILSRPCAAVPLFSSSAPLWAAKRGDEERLGPGGQCLPGQLPPPGGYERRYLMLRPDAKDALLPPADAGAAKRMPLDLSLVGGQFVIESRCLVSLYQPADGFLARWWVNGRPVVAPLAQDEPPDPRDKLLRALGPPAPIRIPAALPQTLGPLKPGDRIALQVMYCPAGFKELGDLRRSQEKVKGEANGYFPAFQPLLSNRLEFKATEAGPRREGTP